MGTSVAVIERELDRNYMPTFANILTQTPNLPAVAFRSAFIEAIARSPDLLDCTQRSLFNCAASFTFAGLLPGPFTGQAFMLPFKIRGVRNAVPVIGYKGYNTLAGRSGIMIEAGVVRKGEKFTITKGSHPKIIHEITADDLEHNDGQIIGAYSMLAKGQDRFSPVVMGIKRILEVKGKSQGSRKEDSPWNDVKGPGFEAMSEKTVRRRQARSIPLNLFVMCDAMETMHDLGTPAWIAPSQRTGQPTIITPEGEKRTPPPPPIQTEKLKDIKIVAVVGKVEGKDKKRECKNIGEWVSTMTQLVKKTPPHLIKAVRKANGKLMYDLAEAGFQAEVQTVSSAMDEREAIK